MQAYKDIVRRSVVILSSLGYLYPEMGLNLIRMECIYFFVKLKLNYLHYKISSLEIHIKKRLFLHSSQPLCIICRLFDTVTVSNSSKSDF